MRFVALFPVDIQEATTRAPPFREAEPRAENHAIMRTLVLRKRPTRSLQLRCPRRPGMPNSPGTLLDPNLWNPPWKPGTSSRSRWSSAFCATASSPDWWLSPLHATGLHADSSHNVDGCEIHLAPPKKSWETIVCLLEFRGIIIPGFFRWCRISSIHSMSRALLVGF